MTAESKQQESGAVDLEQLLIATSRTFALAIPLLPEPARHEVTLSYRREKLVRLKKKNQDALDALLAQGKVKPLFSSQPVEITPGSVRLKVGDATVEIENDYVFVFAGGVPPFEFLGKIGVRFGGPSTRSTAA